MLTYEGRVYRPPSEARSLIVQATVGCSHNTCTFCGMYKGEAFHIKDQDQLMRELEEEARTYQGYDRAFIADGDALCLSTDGLVALCQKIKALFPGIRRIGIYATAKDVNRKSLEDLKTLKDQGLGMVYMGVETGSRDLLKEIKKDASPEDYLEAGDKLKKAGLKQSLTLITGLAGHKRSLGYAKETARLISQMNPDYVSYLTLMLDPHAPLTQAYQEGKFIPVSPEEALAEIYLFLDAYTGKGPSIFRSNHASNYLYLGGNLPEDIPDLKDAIRKTIEMENFVGEEYRRL